MGSEKDYFYGEGLGWTGSPVTTSNIRREMLRVCPKQPCSCKRCSALKAQLSRRRIARMKYHALMWLPPILGAAIALYLAFQIRASYDRGRAETIERFRKECGCVLSPHP